MPYRTLVVRPIHLYTHTLSFNQYALVYVIIAVGTLINLKIKINTINDDDDDDDDDDLFVVGILVLC